MNFSAFLIVHQITNYNDRHDVTNYKHAQPCMNDLSEVEVKMIGNTNSTCSV